MKMQLYNQLYVLFVQRKEGKLKLNFQRDIETRNKIRIRMDQQRFNLPNPDPGSAWKQNTRYLLRIRIQTNVNPKHYSQSQSLRIQ